MMAACASRGTIPECIKHVTGSTICNSKKKEDHYMKDVTDGIDHSVEERNKKLSKNKQENSYIVKNKGCYFWFFQCDNEVDNTLI